MIVALFLVEVKVNTEQKQEVHKMRLEGSSYSKIASALGISENTIKSYCRRNNLNNIMDNLVKSLEPQFVNKIYNTCIQCGKTLTHGKKGHPKKFCSDECRRIWWKANDSQIDKKAWYTLNCIECSRTFKSYGNKNRKFCCHACYIQSRFKKAKEEHDKRAV